MTREDNSMSRTLEIMLRPLRKPHWERETQLFKVVSMWILRNPARSRLSVLTTERGREFPPV